MKSIAYVLMETSTDWEYHEDEGSVEVCTEIPSKVFLTEEARDSYLASRDGWPGDINIVEVEIYD